MPVNRLDDLLRAVAFGVGGEDLHNQGAQKESGRQQEKVILMTGRAGDAEAKQFQKHCRGNSDDDADAGCKKQPFQDAYEEDGAFQYFFFMNFGVNAFPVPPWRDCEASERMR